MNWNIWSTVKSKNLKDFLSLSWRRTRKKKLKVMTSLAIKPVLKTKKWLERFVLLWIFTYRTKRVVLMTRSPSFSPRSKAKVETTHQLCQCGTEQLNTLCIRVQSSLLLAQSDTSLNHAKTVATLMPNLNYVQESRPKEMTCERLFTSPS